MALNPIKFSTNMDSFYTESFMLTPDQRFTRKSDDSVEHPTYPNTFYTKFATAYDDYVSDGEVLSAINDGRDKGILEQGIQSLNRTSEAVTIFATALANYWGTVLLINGSPTHGGVSVASITNDAPSQVSAFESALYATFTSQRVQPPYITLINNIESIALPQVTWTVTEIMPNGSPASFPEKVF